MKARGRVWKLGDDVDTDQMAPFATLTSDWDEVCKSMFPAQRAFVEGVREGDIVVAGRNWGCGSSREHAPENLKRLGIGAVVAESFGRIYFRNCVAIAFPNLACPGVTAIVDDGDEVEVDFATGEVVNSRTGGRVVGTAYTPDMLEIVQRGGLMKVLEDKIAKGELG